MTLCRNEQTTYRSSHADCFDAIERYLSVIENDIIDSVDDIENKRRQDVGFAIVAELTIMKQAAENRRNSRLAKNVRPSCRS